jgi:hypothetical protein
MRAAASQTGQIDTFVSRLEYGARCTKYDSLGEDASRLTFRPSARGATW